MKFAQLTIGQRFVFRDHEYTKISALMAESTLDQQRRLIPRSASVVPTESTTGPQTPPETIPYELLEQTLESLAARIDDILSHSDLSANQRDGLSGELQSAFVQTRQSLLLQIQRLT